MLAFLTGRLTFYPLLTLQQQAYKQKIQQIKGTKAISIKTNTISNSDSPTKTIYMIRKALFVEFKLGCWIRVIIEFITDTIEIIELNLDRLENPLYLADN